jgi:cytoskeletal protein CcmA (bactofilin family)/predicted RNA-binding Zn-ribbon protein involved in translation (DUF1610 family)
MPSSREDRVAVTCPKCGHQQLEPRGAYSTRCQKCREHFRPDESLHPGPIPQKPVIEQRQVTCFQCGTRLEVPKAATSSMCKRCSSHVDLTDYHITATVSKNFRTHGRLVIEEKGYVLNTEAMVAEAVVKGRLIGKLVTQGALELHSTAQIKGTFSAGRLVLPAGQHFRWAEAVRVGGADIAGELAANLVSTGTVRLKATARFFGDIETLNLVVEAGAVLVGAVRVGASKRE